MQQPSETVQTLMAMHDLLKEHGVGKGGRSWLEPPYCLEGAWCAARRLNMNAYTLLTRHFGLDRMMDVDPAYQRLLKMNGGYPLTQFNDTNKAEEVIAFVERAIHQEVTPVNVPTEKDTVPDFLERHEEARASLEHHLFGGGCKEEGDVACGADLYVEGRTTWYLDVHVYMPKKDWGGPILKTWQGWEVRYEFKREEARV